MPKHDILETYSFLDVVFVPSHSIGRQLPRILTRTKGKCPTTTGRNRAFAGFGQTPIS